MTTSTKANLLAVACLLAVAALARADSDNCKPPTGTQACDPNFEYRTSGRGRTKTGSCVACAAGQYTPKQVRGVTLDAACVGMHNCCNACSL